MKHSFVLLTVLVALVAIVVTTADPTPVGSNLNGIADYDRTLPFVNLFKQARKFGSPGQPWDGSAPVDSNGWPTKDFGAVIADDQLHLGGVPFTLRGLFNAKPRIEGIACSPSITNVQWNSSTKVVTATVTPASTDNQLMLGFYDTNGGGRNLTIRPPGYPDSAIFTKEWLAMLSKFSVLRFMDWLSTNGNPVSDWKDRTPPDHASWAYGPAGSTGVPWETCVDLVNAVQKDMWINVPHKATDDYVLQLAKLLQSRLNSNLNIFIEYSNEVWNWSFSQATWNLDAAVEEVDNQGDPNHLNFDKSGNKWYWGYRRVALRLKQITDIFATVWGRDQVNKRLRPVLAGQVANPYVLQLGLEYTSAVWGAPNKFFYAIAGAPYFNIGSTNNNPNMTKEDVLNAFEKSIEDMSPAAGVGVNNFLAQHVQFSKWYNIQMRAYEGGPDTFGPNGIDAKSEATLDPRMKSLCITYLNNWVSYGFKELNWYSSGASDYNTQYGTWSLTNDMQNFNVPKIQAIDAVRNSAPAAPAIGPQLPAAVNATMWVGHSVPLHDPYLRYLRANQTFFYIVRAPQSTTYPVTVFAGTTTSGQQISINVNNQTELVASCPNTGDYEKFAACATISPSFTQGINVIRLTTVTGGYNIQMLQVGAGKRL